MSGNRLKQVLLCLWLAGAGAGAGAGAKIIERVSAVVDDQMISLTYLTKYRKLLSSKLPYPSKLFQLRARKRLSAQKKLLDHLVDELVLKNSLPWDQLNLPSRREVLKRVLKQSKMSRKRLMRELKRTGLSLEEYQELLYNNQAYQIWIDMEVSGAISITDQDINDDYFAKTGKNFFKQYKYELHQWVFELSQEGKKTAHDFLKNTKSKKPETLALTKRQMNQNLRTVIPKLNVGEVSQPLCFSKNCYVFKLLNKSFLVSHKERTEKMRRTLFEKAFVSQLRAWMQERRKTSIIKKYL